MEKRAEGRVVDVYDIKAYALVEMSLHSFLTSSLTNPFLPTHAPSPRFHLVGGWVGFIADHVIPDHKKKTNINHI